MEAKDKLKKLGLSTKWLYGKFAPVIGIINEQEAKEIIEKLKSFDLGIEDESQLKVLTYDAAEIESIYARVAYCKFNNIALRDEKGKIYRFVYEKSNKPFFKKYPDVELDRSDDQFINDFKELLNSLEEKEFDDDAYDRFSRLENEISDILKSFDIRLSTERIRNDLAKFITNNCTLSDDEIIMGLLRTEYYIPVKNLENILHKEAIPSL